MASLQLLPFVPSHIRKCPSVIVMVARRRLMRRPRKRSRAQLAGTGSEVTATTQGPSGKGNLSGRKSVFSQYEMMQASKVWWLMCCCCCCCAARQCPIGAGCKEMVVAPEGPAHHRWLCLLAQRRTRCPAPQESANPLNKVAQVGASCGLHPGLYLSSTSCKLMAAQPITPMAAGRSISC